MDNESKVGDCFKDKDTGDSMIVTGFEGTVVHIFMSDATGAFNRCRMSPSYFGAYCKPITRAEFDEDLQNAFDRIRTELPEAQ